MARVTIEDCLEKVDNRFILIHMAAKRVRQLKKGEPQLVRTSNREVVTALREIAAGKVVLAPKRTREKESAGVKKEMETKPLSVTRGEQGLQERTEQADGEGGERQKAAVADKAVAQGGGLTELSGESLH